MAVRQVRLTAALKGESVENVEKESGTFADGAEQVLRHARTISEELAELVGALGGMARSARSKVDVDRRMRESPGKTLLTAAAVGYVAGGGFFTPFTRRLLRVGARLWLLPAPKRQLMNRQELP